MSQRMRDRQLFGIAVLISILLHLLLLGALPGWRELPRLPVPIVTRLVSEQVLLERTAPLPQSSPALAKPLRPRPESKREVMSTREALVPSVEAPEPLRDSSNSPVDASAAVAAANLSAARSETVTPTPASPAAAAGSVAQYRLAIISLAKGFNRYPRLAVQNNWQGRAEVRVTVGADGTIASPGLRSGSGYEILDLQALYMIGQAAQQVALPAALRGREFSVDIPVIFSLTQAER